MVRIIGVQRMKGTSKKTQKPYEMCLVHFEDLNNENVNEDIVGIIPQQVFVSYELFDVFADVVGTVVEFETSTEFKWGRPQAVIVGIK